MRDLKRRPWGVLAVLLAGTAARAQAPVVDAVTSGIDRLNAAIQQSGGRWVAAETSLSRLPREEQLKRVGTEAEHGAAKPADEVVALEALPPSLDWRTRDGGFVSGVRDQGACGSCWAFAMTGALESNLLFAQKTPGRDAALSEQVLLSCSRVGSCSGGLLYPGFLKHDGLPPESFYPYSASKGNCSQAGAGWKRAAHRIRKWRYVWPSLSSLKAALNRYGPLPTTMLVYDDFMHYRSGVYSYTSGKRLGGHAVLIVGYDDDGRYFIIKNSWGRGWGEDGYFKIAYSEMHDRVLFGLITVAYEAPRPSAAASQGLGPDGAQRIQERIEPVLRQKP